ncbi:MAG: 2-amino-4-hydroxy-6-hydroxymethyldihydropteridine diphosphokinase [Muribaculaceae bacterium]|nr:2-amino-4-hydroxy-6-hydroxymethyldihydropteridine diphosphokinase [Muribaculaceae bacterium]
MSHKATICIGSNTPDSARRLFAAVEYIVCCAQVEDTSGQYQSEAEFQGHHPGVPLYMNEVLKLRVDESYEDFQARLKRYEGDVRAESSMRYPGLVGVDIDIVVWDGVVLRPRDVSSRYFRRGLELLGDC